MIWPIEQGGRKILPRTKTSLWRLVMTVTLKVFVFLIGALFLFLGLAGLFTPENFANSLGLEMTNPEGAGTVRAMIGAHYVAMGGVCFYAVIRQTAVLLIPIAAIEVVMVIARGIAAVNGEVSSATLVPTTIEILAVAILVTAAMKLPSS
tara:strand:- start:505 stop:954 length:450 start_codon:yes stop_codon:yes gene_type:complete